MGWRSWVPDWRAPGAAPAAVAGLLEPGMILCYRGSSGWSRLIMLKSWAPVSHVEGVSAVLPDGRVRVVAARDGVGVNEYDYTPINLWEVRAAPSAWDVPAAMHWFDTGVSPDGTAGPIPRGQAYDWIGLLRIGVSVGPPDATKQFCSELLARWCRVGGLHLVAPDYDADLVSPGMVRASPALPRVIWRAGGAR